jgi:hypothetical protein
MGTIIIPDKLIYDIESRIVAKTEELKRALLPHEITNILVATIQYHSMHLVKREQS